MIPGGGLALVTGSTDGLGYAVAEGLARAGCEVLLHGLEDESAMRERCAALGKGKAHYVRADLASGDGVKRLADAARAHGHVGILVNNAVVRHFAPLAEFPADAWQRALAVNVTAPLQLVQAVLPGMRARQWGRIINMVSVYATRGTAGRVDYVTSKSALMGLTRAIAMETTGDGITCNGVCPGTVLTPGIEQRVAASVAGGMSRDEAERQVLAGKQPTGRFIEAADVAQLVVFLCGTAARDITGAMLPMEGGWLSG
jgi:3-hydroxybutyrate dehydrogenase